MNYIFLLYDDESTGAAPGTPEFDEMMAGYMAFDEETRANGVFVSGEPLESVASATTVAVRDGKSNVTDGPFAETKEQLGGFYILDCKDLDEALKYAAKIPAAKSGRVEVRPIMIIPGMND
ncbi:UNVERIFIED_CONTAM: hypothetical protein GTU68_001208 [Idotea baltica]|nr:hypothetical protein [Idotea baltica]